MAGGKITSTAILLSVKYHNAPCMVIFDLLLDKANKLGFFAVILGPIRALGKLRKNLVITRYFTYIFLSIWKMIVFFNFMILSVWLTHGNVSNLFSKASDSFATHRINVTEIRAPESGVLPDIPGSGLLVDVIPERSNQYAVQYALFIQIMAAYICYIFGT